MKNIAVIIIMLAVVLTGPANSIAASAPASSAKPAEKVAIAKTTPDSNDKNAKTTAPVEDKYPATYAKCTKVAEADELKYDQLFEDCMEKNGFSQTEFIKGGLPIDSVEGD